jgi:hypothetical protein
MLCHQLHGSYRLAYDNTYNACKLLLHSKLTTT